jgi:hypothetical protein
MAYLNWIGSVHIISLPLQQTPSRYLLSFHNVIRLHTLAPQPVTKFTLSFALPVLLISGPVVLNAWSSGPQCLVSGPQCLVQWSSMSGPVVLNVWSVVLNAWSSGQCLVSGPQCLVQWSMSGLLVWVLPFVCIQLYGVLCLHSRT